MSFDTTINVVCCRKNLELSIKLNDDIMINVGLRIIYELKENKVDPVAMIWILSITFERRLPGIMAYFITLHFENLPESIFSVAKTREP